MDIYSTIKIVYQKCIVGKNLQIPVIDENQDLYWNLVPRNKSNQTYMCTSTATSPSLSISCTTGTSRSILYNAIQSTFHIDDIFAIFFLNKALFTISLLCTCQIHKKIAKKHQHFYAFFSTTRKKVLICCYGHFRSLNWIITVVKVI